VCLLEMPGAALALLCWALAGEDCAPLVIVTDGRQSLDTVHQDLLTLMPSDAAGRPARLLYFPSRESDGGTPSDPELTGQRLEVLLQLAEISAARPPARAGCVLATCVQALMQKTMGPEPLRKKTVLLSPGSEIEPSDLVLRLERSGYTIKPEVEEKGDAAARGGLVDAWPPTSVWPLRIEFFGPVVESIREFDPLDQRSRGKTLEAVLAPAAEFPPETGEPPSGTVQPLSYLPEGVRFVWLDEGGIHDHAAIHEEVAVESSAQAWNLTFRQLSTGIKRKSGNRRIVIAAERPRGGPRLDIEPLPEVLDLPREALQPVMLEQARARLIADLGRRASAGHDIHLYFDTQGSLDHFRSEAAKAGAAAFFHLQRGVLSAGFASDSMRLVVAAEADIYGRRKRSERRYDPGGDRPRPRRDAGMHISDLTDIEPGDLVVHVDHGIGRYLGLREIVFNERNQEVISIEYAEGAMLHVPVSHAHLLSRYVGMSRRPVALHRLGGARWKRDRNAASRAVLDLASSLLETQARRKLLAGFAFSTDHPWQREFDCAFPYRTTPDQERAIGDVMEDMASSRPMDRLVCGDAGYGKTEVAMRAAFAAVMNGKQVAVLVPTTVLAQQHFRTFTARISAYPVRVEMLSRFQSRGRQAEIVRGLAEGTVDVVIGTHALLQPQVRFRDLGLVVIDEEQRFGVEHKERLKRMRELVDVLTLTATPIPRTLYLSMTGGRDMSLIQTPPGERMAIETIVTRNTDETVRGAVMRELNREGQVFYLHNRVLTIDRAYARLKKLVPEAGTEIAHGQMPSGELRSVMQRFAAGEFNVLVCTTIVESGVDIPRANTILIDRADRFGIADLYQLRGRVGRSNRKAYAYLLLPAQGRVDADARKRIGAVKKFSSLSAGFSLALRDLEIRGAGNLLGAEQSGNVTAVGFGLYCQLLRGTIARLRGEPAPTVVDVDTRLDFVDLSPHAADRDRSALVPYDYVEDERLRIGVYRRMAEASSVVDTAKLAAELADRFGPPPAPVRRMLKIADIRLRCAERGINRVETRGDKLMLSRTGEYVMHNGRFPRLSEQDTGKRLEEIQACIEALPAESQTRRSKQTQ